MLSISSPKKTLYEAITGLFIGLIFVVCPIFVFATVAQPKTLPYVYDGNTYTQTFGSGNYWFYCTEDCFPYMHADHILICKEDGGGCSYFPEHYAYFDCSSGCPENPTSVNGQYMASDGWYASVDDMHSTKDVKERGGYDYIGLRGGLHIVANLEVVHIADIEPPPPVCSIGHCSYCEVWTTCQTAGCNWSCAPDWSGIGCWCSEPASSPEACGGFFKCQYCETEAACTDVTCEWNTRGGITKCFTKLPVIPEAQEEWQGCEFDNCDPDPPLGTIEKWICVLRNSIQGIYCPTQATMSALQDTVNSFETKFPFNYIEAMKQFFIDIKTSLATPKTVPIKMLGVSMGNLDFSIFDSNITIGGQTETIGEFCTFLSTILIYFGLFFWILAILRRFF